MGSSFGRGEALGTTNLPGGGRAGIIESTWSRSSKGGGVSLGRSPQSSPLGTSRSPQRSGATPGHCHGLLGPNLGQSPAPSPPRLPPRASRSAPRIPVMRHGLRARNVASRRSLSSWLSPPHSFPKPRPTPPYFHGSSCTARAGEPGGVVSTSTWASCTAPDCGQGREHHAGVESCSYTHIRDQLHPYTGVEPCSYSDGTAEVPVAALLPAATRYAEPHSRVPLSRALRPR